MHGSVETEDVQLTVEADLTPGERTRGAIRGDFDVAEISLGTYLAGWPNWDFTAIPVSPRRFFPHSRLFVHAESTVDSPADLRGGRVGILSWDNSLALWTRGILTDTYGLDLSSVEWCVSKEGRVPLEPPVDITELDVTTDDRHALVDRLIDGDLDCLVYPLVGVRLIPSTRRLNSSSRIRWRKSARTIGGLNAIQSCM